MKIMCWDHCGTCGRSQNRFWVKSKRQFKREKAEVLGHKCAFCGGDLNSYMEQEEVVCESL